ncbi:MAG: PilZ domain-containing protein, partial [Deltaproteobacteria bacterium]|nr:PilZ domain-containing protein [Deltaproteobacteria bacterium]
MDSPFTVADISLSGISLMSAKPFLPGSVLQLQLGKAFQVDASVVGCDMEETDSDLMEMQYRIRCRFTDLVDTKQILVMIKEMDLLSGSEERKSG